ncbi:hypothetical protein [Isoptericola cucumis]|uniref:hypothetical protein n=1 Tax=Isoptericola cucumis TaxID=1776856 RepID=UPI0039F09783
MPAPERASDDDAARAAHLDDGRRVAYGRWRRWVRSLRRRSMLVRVAEGGGDPSDRVYLAYGVVLLALVYGPILWSALAQAGTGLRTAAVVGAANGAGAWDTPDVARLVAGGLLALGVAAAAALAAARAGGPLSVSPAEATFVLGGQFRPRVVLRRRGAALVAGAAVVAAFGATALAHGAGDGAGPVAWWGVCAALLAQVPLAVGVGAQAPRWRRASTSVTAVLLVVGGVAATAALLDPARGRTTIGVACLAPDGGEAPCPVDVGLVAGQPGAGLVVGAALVGLAAVGLVLQALPDEVDVDAAASGHRSTVAAGRGLVGGESGAVADVLGPVTYGGRRARLPGALLRRAPVVARDLLGLRRRPVALAGSLAVGGVGGLLVLLGAGAAGEGAAAGGASPVAVVVGAALLYAASATWCGGLRALAAQTEPGALLPGGPGRQVAAHAVVPVLVGILAAALGGGVTAAWAAAAGASVSAAGPAVLLLVLVIVLVLAARVWVAGATTAPPGVFTPMVTPAGDASMLVLGAWYLRGWLVVIGTAWLLHRATPGGEVVAAVGVAALAAWLVTSGVRRLAGS